MYRLIRGLWLTLQCVCSAEKKEIFKFLDSISECYIYIFYERNKLKCHKVLCTQGDFCFVVPCWSIVRGAIRDLDTVIPWDYMTAWYESRTNIVTLVEFFFISCSPVPNIYCRRLQYLLRNHGNLILERKNVDIKEFITQFVGCLAAPDMHW